MTGLRATTMDVSKAKIVQWAWKNRLVKDNFNLVIGNEGIGKGTLVAYVLAQMTKGKLQGNLWGKPVSVGIIGYEDSFEHVWTPRLAVTGADAKRVHAIDRGDLDQIDIRRDIGDLANLIHEHRIRVLYFDQFLDNLATDADHYHAKQVRAAMSPLAVVAKELRVTIIATMHPNKRADNFRQLVQGSSAFNAVARSSLLVAEHPTEENVRVLITAKSNYGVTGHELEFKIVGDQLRNGRVINTSRVIGFKKSVVRLDDLIEASKGQRRTTNKDRISTTLKEVLGDGEWHPSAKIIADLVFDGYAERTVQRTATQLQVEKRKVKFEGGWEWKLLSR